MLASLGGTLQEQGAGGRGLRQTIAGAVRPRRALVIDQGFDVGGLLDLLTSIPAARVARQFLRAVQDADQAFVGQLVGADLNLTTRWSEPLKLDRRGHQI